MRQYRFEEIIGKVLFVCNNYYNCKNELIDRREVIGKIVEADDCHTVIEQNNGEKFGLPPCTENLQYAAHGTYNIHSTGEFVVDPDYLAMWNVAAPTKK